MTQAYLMIL